MTEEIGSYLSGEKLYGDDFSLDQIREWFQDEAEGYADLGAKQKSHYSYHYHQLNKLHGFRHLRGRRFQRALGIGSAYGDEFRPIASRISQITVLEPSDSFLENADIYGTPCHYRKPQVCGNIEFESEYFDLITSLGVMHHIPNVSHVLSECYRCLSKGGIMLLREPITSMGDWRKPRPGLTKRERGIPLKLLDKLPVTIGFRIAHRSLCNFPLIPRLANIVGISAYDNLTLTLIDGILSKAFYFNYRYHRTRMFDRLAPASVYYVLEK